MKTLVFLNGKKFTNWEKVIINRSIDSICGSFSISAVYDYGTQTTAESPFELSGLVEIFTSKQDGKEPTSNQASTLPSTSTLLVSNEDSTKIMTGYIDVVDTTIGEEGLNVEVSGRDITCDLVDCTIESKTAEWLKIKASELFTAWCTPFSIKIDNQTDKSDTIVNANPKPDQKVNDAIMEISRTEGFLVITDENGQLVLEDKNEGEMNSPLVLGENILTASYKGDYTKRYSKITVLDNADESSSPALNVQRMLTSGASNATESDPVVDQSAKRYRPVVIMGSGNLKAAGATSEAKWRMSMSVASTFTLSVSVQGWLSNFGQLWRVNRNTYCSLQDLNLPSGRMLIKNITFESGDNGTFTNMDLIHPDAYDEFDGTTDEDDKTGKGDKNIESLFRKIL